MTGINVFSSRSWLSFAGISLTQVHTDWSECGSLRQRSPSGQTRTLTNTCWDTAEHRKSVCQHTRCDMCTHTHTHRDKRDGANNIHSLPHSATTLFLHPHLYIIISLPPLISSVTISCFCAFLPLTFFSLSVMPSLVIDRSCWVSWDASLKLQGLSDTLHFLNYSFMKLGSRCL